MARNDRKGHMLNPMCAFNLTFKGTFDTAGQFHVASRPRQCLAKNTQKNHLQLPEESRRDKLHRKMQCPVNTAFRYKTSQSGQPSIPLQAAPQSRPHAKLLQVHVRVQKPEMVVSRRSKKATGVGHGPLRSLTLLQLPFVLLKWVIISLHHRHPINLASCLPPLSTMTQASRSRRSMPHQGL